MSNLRAPPEPSAASSTTSSSLRSRRGFGLGPAAPSQSPPLPFMRASEAVFLAQHHGAAREALEREMSAHHALRFHIDDEEAREIFASPPEDDEPADSTSPQSASPDQQQHGQVQVRTDAMDGSGSKLAASSQSVSASPRISGPVVDNTEQDGDNDYAAHGRHPSFLSDARTVLVWRDLTVTVTARGTTKVLLDHVSGCMSGGLWAVMGPSGCGKSTLLNTLACRLDVNNTVTGEMRLNGRPYHHAELKQLAGYVMQDDLLNPNLTVRETLYYTAALRLPRSFTAAERDARINEVIREMGLSHCQDVIVGDPSKKGISGGERRRVCIGMELLSRPTLLFLDEPTSGLDSVTAFSLVELLHRIARSGKCSMMISIHQPQARLFALFDRLLLLKSGKILFSGSIPDALQLFSDCGFPVPALENPADHLLDIITPQLDPGLTQQLEADTQATVEAAAAMGVDLKQQTGSPDLGTTMVSPPPGQDASSTATSSASADGSVRADIANSAKLLEQFQASKAGGAEVDLGFGSTKPLLLERDQLPWFGQFHILIRRNLHDAHRRQGPLLFAVVQSIVIGLLFGFAFFQIGDGQKSVVRRIPACFFFCVNQGVVGGLTIINAFPSERALMLRERAAGTYYVSAYFCAKILVDTLVSLPVPIVFGTLAYWIIGLQGVAGKFFVFLVLLVLCNLSATSLALMISALCKTTDLATTVLPMILEVGRLFGGFYLAPINLPKYFSWLDALSYIKYSYVGIALNELHGLELECDQPAGQPCTPDGATTIRALGLDYIQLGGCIGVLLGYVIFCQFVAFLAIRFNKSQ